jgi:sugar/nucleoside kinase (ribokinase family)
VSSKELPFWMPHDLAAPAGPIVVAGNLSLDDTVTPFGAYPAAPGGDALYACLGARAWGSVPLLLTLVGEDYPAEHLSRIEAAGIDTSRIRHVPGPTVHYRVVYRAEGSRVFEWVSAEDRLALTSPTAADYAGLEAAAWLHLAAMPIEAQEVGIAAGRVAGVPISLDPHEEYLEGYEERMAAMVEGVAFLPSELEVRLLFPDLDRLAPLPFAFAAAERLDTWHPTLVAIKLAARGSVVRWQGRSVHVPAPRVDVVDSTGAGDAYCGGFVAGWLATGSPAVAAACGTIAAGEIVGRYGAFADGSPPGADARVTALSAILAALPSDDRDGADPGALATRVGQAFKTRTTIL